MGCDHKIDDRESYIEGPVYTCYCGKQFTVEDLINERASLMKDVELLFALTKFLDWKVMTSTTKEAAGKLLSSFVQNTND